MSFLGDIFKSVLGIKDPPQPEKQSTAISDRSPTEVSLPFIVGNSPVRLQAVDIFKRLDTKKEIVGQVLVWCVNQVATFSAVKPVTLYANDTDILDAKFAATKGGRWITAMHYTGAPDQSATGWTAFNSKFGWENTNHGRGLTLSLVMWTRNVDVFGSEPRFYADVTRASLSLSDGSQSWPDSYAANPAAVYQYYLRDPVIGENYNAEDVGDSFQECIDWLITQTVEQYPGGPQVPKFTVNGQISTGLSKKKKREMIEDAFFAKMTPYDGKLHLNIKGRTTTPVLDFNRENIVGDFNEDGLDKRKRYNRVTVSFPSPEMNFEDDFVSYPEAGDPLYDEWLADDNYVEKETTIKRPLCNNAYEGLLHAKVEARESRETTSVKFTAQVEASQLVQYDVISVTDPLRDWDKKLFLVIKVKDKESEEGKEEYEITAESFNPTIYDWAAQGEYVPQQAYLPPTDEKLGDVTDIAFDVNARMLTWLPPVGESISHYNVLIDGEKYGSPIVAAIAITKPIGVYLVEVQAVGRFASSDYVEYQLAVTNPITPPNNVSIDNGNGVITVTPPSPDQINQIYEGLYTTDETLDPNVDSELLFYFIPGGRSLVIPTPAHGVTYYVWYRLKTDGGEGTWYVREVVSSGIVIEQLAPQISIPIQRVNIGGEIDTIISNLADYAQSTRETLTETQEITGSNNQALQAQSERIAAVDIKADGTQEALDILELTVGDPDNPESVIRKLDRVISDSQGNAQAVSAIQARVDNGGDIAEALIELQSVSESVDGIKATARFGIDINGNFTGTYVNGNKVSSSFTIQAPNFNVYDPVLGQNAIEYSANRMVVRAKLILDDGYVVDSVDAIRAQDGGTGPQGPQGNTGAQGIKGNTGATGSQGIQGVQGAQGIQGLRGYDGPTGASGAGFFGSTYPAISWTTSTASTRFTQLVGRSPVQFDIFTQTRTDGTDSQARQFNGSSWGTVALQVNGSIIARDTIAGDRFIAGTEITAPLITGGVLETGVLRAGSAMIVTDGGRLAPVSIFDFAYKQTGSRANKTLYLPVIHGPADGSANEYNHHRAAWYKFDAMVDIIITTDSAQDNECPVNLDVWYDFYDSNQAYHQSWQTVYTSVLNDAQGPFYGTMPLMYRYTSRDAPWKTMQMRVRTSATNNEGMPLAARAFYIVNNNLQSPYTQHTVSGDNNENPTTSQPTNPDYGAFYCVTEDMWLTDAMQAAMVTEGDMIDVADTGPLRKGEVTGVVLGRSRECVEISTANGCSVTCSIETPITRQDGSFFYATESLGENVYTDLDGIESWEQVVDVKPAGKQRIVRISVGNHSYASGKEPNKRIVTHNAYAKR